MYIHILILMFCNCPFFTLFFFMGSPLSIFNTSSFNFQSLSSLCEIKFLHLSTIISLWNFLFFITKYHATPQLNITMTSLHCTHTYPHATCHPLGAFARPSSCGAVWRGCAARALGSSCRDCKIRQQQWAWPWYGCQWDAQGVGFRDEGWGIVWLWRRVWNIIAILVIFGFLQWMNTINLQN